MLTLVEISKSNLLNNIKVIKKLISPQIKIASVVKANAYGHDLEQVIKILEEKVDYFQVNSLEELIQVKKIAKTPVLVLGYVEKSKLKKLVKFNGIPGIYDKARLIELNKIGKDTGKKLKIHLKIDAHLGRQGILPKEIKDYLKLIKKLNYIKLDGIYAHFANIEDTSSKKHPKKQLETFQKVIEIVEEEGFRNIIKHISATSGIFLGNELNTHFDLVRTGIGQYGLWPSEDLKNKYKTKVNLKPVLTWKTKIAQVKTIKKSETVGYGLTYKAPKDIKVAVIPIGYSDGYSRLLSNKGCVLIKGKRCAVLGRIAMNMFVVNVSKIPVVEAEDEVILIGNSKKEQITAEEIAKQTNTINYEIITGINPLIPRVTV